VSKGKSRSSQAGSKLAVVIMAAGKGTRLKSRRPKVLHEVGGKPLLGHVIEAASHIVAPADIYVIVGHQAERVRDAVSATGVHFIEQTEQRGTGHAIQCARKSIADYDDVLVLSGDVPLIRPETIEKVIKFHLANHAAMTILTAEPDDPTGYGRVLPRSADSAEVESIIEQNALTTEQESLRQINSGIYAFKIGPLLAHLDKITADNAHGELYLTDMARLLRDAGQRVVSVQATEAVEVLGTNTIAEVVALDAALRVQAAKRLMAAGVTIFRPDTCVIDADVEVQADTIIEPFVQLLGSTRIGANCHIRSYTVVENCTLGDRVLLRQSCILSDSVVADGAKIGPFAHLRPGSDIGEDAHVGNFVETKKARLGKGAKANHLTYLGDAEVGAGSNIGAGVITCNYEEFTNTRPELARGSSSAATRRLLHPFLSTTELTSAPAHV